MQLHNDKDGVDGRNLGSPLGETAIGNWGSWVGTFTGSLNGLVGGNAMAAAQTIGGGDQSIASGSGPVGLAVDDTHVYWTNPGTNRVGRARIDGSHVRRQFITGAGAPVQVAVDRARIFWTNNAFNAVGRARIDGSHIRQRFITGASGPSGMAIDPR